ncbi:MAG: phosphoenolpyruvate--protein phosphotransferase [Sphaerochaeta sp.]
MRIFTGLAISEGIAQGKAKIYRHTPLVVQRHAIALSQVPGELTQLDRAFEGAHVALKNRQSAHLAGEALEIWETHLMMLQDPTYIASIKEMIETKLITASWATEEVTQAIIHSLEASDDELFRQRAIDIKDIGQSIVEELSGKKSHPKLVLDEPIILLADSLLPSELFSLDRSKILGLSLDGGGFASHVAILARGLDIPTVIETHLASHAAHDGDEVIVDGIWGEVIIRADHRAAEKVAKRHAAYLKHEAELRASAALKAVTRDGKEISIQSNIQTLSELQFAQEEGSDGVGLFRTEFFFMERSKLPSEEEQFAVYKEVLETLSPKSVTIRTLDLGGDKIVSGLNLVEENPVLGFRAVRFCLEHKDIFLTQLRALLRASAFGSLKIMFPMISGVQELKQSLRILHVAKLQLKEEGVAFDPDLQVGTMIEVPSAALVTDLLIPYVDFISIGTNDLIQYTIAVDRNNQKIAHLYQPLHPGVLRLLKTVVDHAHKAGKKVAVCGEMAAEAHHAVVLVGLGVDELSMGPHALLKLRKIIRSIDLAAAQDLVAHLLTLENYVMTEEAVREWMHERFDDLTIR